jgi:hypothetical protein
MLAGFSRRGLARLAPSSSRVRTAGFETLEIRALMSAAGDPVAWDGTTGGSPID